LGVKNFTVVVTDAMDHEALVRMMSGISAWTVYGDREFKARDNGLYIRR